MKIKKFTRRTIEQKEDLVNKITNLRNTGTSIGDACKKYNIHPSMYYDWKTNQIPKVITYNAGNPTKKKIKKVKNVSNKRLIALVGSPDEVVAALERL